MQHGTEEPAEMTIAYKDLYKAVMAAVEVRVAGATDVVAEEVAVAALPATAGAAEVFLAALMAVE